MDAGSQHQGSVPVLSPSGCPAVQAVFTTTMHWSNTTAMFKWCQPLVNKRQMLVHGSGGEVLVLTLECNTRWLSRVEKSFRNHALF